MIPRGARIAVVAPCGPYPPARFAEGVKLAEEAGYTLDLWPEMLQPWRYLAAPDEVRLAHLEAALRSDAHDAVWIARGGYGLTRLLRRLSLDSAVPKPVIGFSDTTALFARLWQAGWTQLVHGPVVNSLPITTPASRAHLWETLDGAGAVLRGEPWLPGEAAGTLLGGNLCLLAALCGTPWQLDVRGAILVLEEVGEAPYRVDRMLRQLVDAGGLEGVQAIAVGELEGCRPPDDAAWAMRDVFVDALSELGVPVLGGLPIGHGANNHAFRWGAPARLHRDHLAFG